MLSGIASKNDKVLVHSVFSQWLGWLLKHQADKEIHDKFKKEIQDCEDALINFRKKQLGISKGMLGRSAAQGDMAIVAETLRVWYKWVIEEGHNKEMDGKLAEAQAKFNGAQQSAKDASKSVMARMSAGNDAALINLCFTTWVQAQEELLKDKEIDALAKKAEAQYKEFMAKKRSEATGVLDRMSAGSDAGLLHLIISAWIEEWKGGKAQADMDKILNGQDERFKSLNQKQKGNAKSVASKCHQQEEENMIMVFFYAWATEAKEQHVVKVYGGKLDQKKHQLEAVQTMFKSFASQLEQGISNSPRSKKGSGRSKGGEGSTIGA